MCFVSLFFSSGLLTVTTSSIRCVRACVRACPGQTTRMECVLFPTRWKRGMPLQHYQKCVLPNGTAPLGSETIMQILNLIYIDWLIFFAPLSYSVLQKGAAEATHISVSPVWNTCSAAAKEHRERGVLFTPKALKAATGGGGTCIHPGHTDGTINSTTNN